MSSKGGSNECGEFTCLRLDSDDSGDLASNGHGPVSLAGRRRHHLLVNTRLYCTRLGLDEQLMSLAVLVHRYCYDLLLHTSPSL